MTLDKKFALAVLTAIVSRTIMTGFALVLIFSIPFSVKLIIGSAVLVIIFSDPPAPIKARLRNKVW